MLSGLVKIVQGIFRVKGSTDNTLIGNVGDALKVTATFTTLPDVNIQFIKDGIPQDVIEDTVTPANNVPLPVKITGLDGDVVINSSNLNLEVQLSDQGVDADVVRIGDGTTQLGITVSNEAKVKEASLDVTLSTRASEATLSAINAKLNSLGQKTMAASVPVVIASDQSSLNINNISGTISLPTGASTLAEQQTQTTSLQLIDDITHSQNVALNKGVPLMGHFDDAATTVATEDNVAVVRITAQRGLHTNLRNDSGNEIGTASSPLRNAEVGASTSNINTQINVTTASTQLLAANSNRRLAYIANNTSATIFIKFGAAAVADEGLELGSGDVFYIGNNFLWTGSVFGIKASGAGVDIDVFEGTF